MWARVGSGGAGMVRGGKSEGEGDQAAVELEDACAWLFLNQKTHCLRCELGLAGQVEGFWERRLNIIEPTAVCPHAASTLDPPVWGAVNETVWRPPVRHPLFRLSSFLLLALLPVRPPSVPCYFLHGLESVALFQSNGALYQSRVTPTLDRRG